MRVFLTGATGYVGQAVTQASLLHGHDLQILVRSGSEHKLQLSAADRPRVTIVHGDVLDAASVEQGMHNCDAVIHLVGIIREFPARSITFDRLHVQSTRHITESAQKLGIKRYVHMSALGARVGSLSGYSHSKGLAERIVRESDLDWTIFRPSIIFGPKDEFVNMLADMIRKAPLLPIIGSGEYRLQPIALEQVAAAFAQSLTMPETIRNTYDVGGPESFSYNEMLDEIASALGKKKPKLHVPLAVMRPIIRLMERYSFFPITRAQLYMLLEGNTCDPTPFQHAFGMQPVPFALGIRQYL
jgi:NADH dehydrogenase